MANPMSVPMFSPDGRSRCCSSTSRLAKGEFMSNRYPTVLLRSLFVFLVFCTLLIPTIAQGQAIIKVNDNVNFRLGVLLQGWADATQDPSTQDYIQQIFLRRMRILLGGQISPNVSFFFETDNPNLGRTPKVLNTGFITQDAFVEWKPMGKNSFIIDGGLFLPALCRNCIESAASLLSLDYGTWSFLESAVTQSSVGRDTGIQAKGYLMGNKLEYRAGVFNGFRQPAAAGEGPASNPMRFTGRLSYNPWDTEIGYVYPGMYFGNKKVLQFGGGFDHQENYNALTADAFLSLPMGPAPATPAVTPGAPPPPAPNRNALNAEVALYQFDGDTTFTTLPKQNDFTIQAGYYLAGPKVMPWIRYEKQDFDAASRQGGNNDRQQVGFTWFPNGHNFNAKAAYSHTNLRTGNDSDQFTVQLQFFYY